MREKRMSGRGKKDNLKAAGGYILSAVVFVLALAAFVGGTMFFSQKTGREGTDTLRDAIRRASVQCYAIEGRYPPNVGYLEENYGIQIDRSKYNVFYSGFASNIMPEITVMEVED